MQKIGFCERYKLTTAVLKHFKTNTRRLEKKLQRAVEDYKKKYGEEPVIKYQEWVREGNFLRVHCEHGLLSFQTRYKLGEVVAVAQAYNDFYNDECDPRQFPEGEGWTNKMFVKPSLMPHQIQMTGVRIEKLQDISDEDCLKEGIMVHDGMPAMADLYVFNGRTPLENYLTPREAFAALINRPGVGHKGLWESNPWVVVYEFKLVK